MPAPDASPQARTVYDDIPYNSYVYPFTQPSRIGAVGKLFGLRPVAPQKARVLELGCAHGINLLPMASRFPDAQFVGIDLSAVQIAAAEASRAELGLANIRFERMSIDDVDAQFGKFDYIVAHGIYSWVPAATREAIMRIGRTNLSDNGLLQVSYNTFPGWHGPKVVRDILMYHTARFASLGEKMAQSRELLKFIRDGVGDGLSVYRDLMDKELAFLEANDPQYYFHDYLEEVNQPFYLHEVAAAARANELEYVGDSNVQIMYPQNFPDRVAQMLQTADDPVRLEQYIDFLTNRRFRVSIFCRNAHSLSRNIDRESIFGYHIRSAFLPRAADSVDLAADKPCEFAAGNGLTCTTRDRHSTALVLAMANAGCRALAADDLVKEACRLLGAGPSDIATTAKVRHAMAELGMRLVFTGCVALQIGGDPATPADLVHPKAFAPARAAAMANKSWVPSRAHEGVTLDVAQKALLVHCDGTADIAKIGAGILKLVDADILKMNLDGKEIRAETEETRNGLVQAWIENQVALFERTGLLD